jgi:hypothetical protein
MGSKVSSKASANTVKAERDEVEVQRAAGISLYFLNGNSEVLAKKMFCTLTTHRIIFSKDGSSEFLYLSSIQKVETVGKKSSVSRMIGVRQEYSLVLKTQTGAWSLVFAKAFPGSIRKPDHERDDWAEKIKSAIGQANYVAL